MNNVDTFTTKSGTKYIFDGTTGFISPISEKLFKCVNNTTKLDRDLIIENADDSLSAAIRKWSLFSTPSKIDLNINSIKNSIEEYPYPQLILGITEDCNLRCKYCIFSGNYIDMRTHKAKTMNTEVALKSVDYYIDNQNKFKKKAPEKESVISFYGGEPLLNFNLIKRVVSHVKKRRFKTLYAITTNATLLTKEIIEFLVSNNFLVSISLDGSEKEHNRNRVYPNGHGTYKKVMQGIRLLTDEIQRQGKTEELPILILTCYDEKTNLIHLNKFFSENDLLARHPGRVSQVIPADGNQEINPTMSPLFLQYIYELKNGYSSKKLYFEERIFGTIFKMMLARNVMPYGDSYTNSLGNACIPGGKYFVDTDGNYHVCERISYNFPIGNYKQGLDYDAILELLTKWQKEVSNYCGECAYKGICGLCFANCAENKTFDINKICQSTRKLAIRRQLEYAHSLLEYDSDIMRNYASNRTVVNKKFLRLARLMESC